MPRVFVSHSSLDRELIDREIVSLLQRHGVDTWYSKDSIHAADEWEEKIKEGLTACDWFLVVLSHNSAKSKWVKAEVNWALSNRQGRLVPVAIDDSRPEDLHLLLSQIQYLDFSEPTDAVKAKLIAKWDIDGGVKHAAAQSGKTTSITPRSASPTSRWWRQRSVLLTTCSAAIVGLCILLWMQFRNPAQEFPGNSKSTVQAGLDSRLDVVQRQGSSQQKPSLEAASETADELKTKDETPPDSPPPHDVPAVANETVPAAPNAGTAPPAEEPREIQLMITMGPQREPSDRERSDVEFMRRQVVYEAKRSTRGVEVRYTLPYLDELGKGPISPDNYGFGWFYPKLAVNVLNNTAQTLFLTEIDMVVVHSEQVLQPIPLVRSGLVRAMEFYNEGWGDLKNAELRFSVVKLGTTAEPPFAHVVTETAVAENWIIWLDEYLTEELLQEQAVEIFGSLTYDAPNGRATIPFSTYSIMSRKEITPGGGVSHSFTYPLFLPAGASGYTKTIPIAQQIKPGDADQFLLEVATDRAARFKLRLVFKAIDNTVVAEQNVDIDVFMARSFLDYLDKQHQSEE